MTYKEALKEFDEIRPYEPEEMRQAFDDMLNDRQFNVLMKGFAPWLPKTVRNSLLPEKVLTTVSRLSQIIVISSSIRHSWMSSCLRLAILRLSRSV